MFDAIDLLNAIKKAAKDAVESSQPTDFCFGKVTSTAPLNIKVDEKLILTPAQLVLTRNVTDFKTKMTIDVDQGKKEITIHNSLSVGDKVVLLQKKGGQKYLVIDRVVSA